MAIAFLIVIFLVVFAIIGLHVYGGTVTSGVYPNCDSFANSLILVFQASRRGDVGSGVGQVICLSAILLWCRYNTKLRPTQI